MHISPITCYRPTPEAAASFAALPYDVFDDEEAMSYVASHPGSFLAVDRPETGFPAGQDPYAPEVYEHAGRLIRHHAQDGTLLKDTTPCFYLYRLEREGRAQLGVVAACSVSEYEQGVIRRHENTRLDKTRDRVRHILACGAQTGPVFLAYRDSMAIDVIARAACAASPIYDFVSEQGVRQTVWRIERSAAVESLQLAFASVPVAYIADGHHRASAAADVGQELRAHAAEGDSPLPSDEFLAVLFPASQLTCLAYNRVVADTNGLDEAGLVAALEQAGFDVSEPCPDAVNPAEAHTFGLYAFGAWRTLRCRDAVVPDEGDPVAHLDVSILQERVLDPILGITDPRTSSRISFVGGIEGTDGLERRTGTGGLAFSLYPTSVDELMAVSDAGELMPPKSTWFEPKLLSGLFLRRITPEEHVVA